MVIGAAGWGKTTAVATWSRGRPTAWLRYEDHDGDAERLLAGLLRALQAHVPVPAPGLGTVPDDIPQVGSSAAALCLWLHSALSKDVVLVLDDKATDHEAAEGPAYDAQTVAWLRGLRVPDQRTGAHDDLPVADVDVPVHTDIVDADWLELLVTRPADGATS